MMRRAFLLCALGMASLALAAHPANVPSAVVKVKPDHSTEIRVRFDMLAYVLDLTPQEASDSAMHALLDGTAADLQSRLDDAK
ncbi:MAG: hypothetical protein QOJ65_103, partial [Fimbriimonadaceae bacterium]|nr:hypothetical protein [Fimbriimonadaceae bacterium]